MSRELKITVGNDGEDGRRFVDAWHAAEGSAGDGSAVERLVFEDLETLLRHLTPGRWRLLRELRRLGPSSVRALAKALARDYKGVHTDVRTLETIGLVERNEDRRVLVPWQVVVAELLLAA